eukprot:gene18575-24300_t
MSQNLTGSTKFSGTNPNASSDDIIENEILKLQEKRFNINEENSEYLKNHPELDTIIDSYINAVLTNKPNNIVKFSSEYFESLFSGNVQGPAPVVFAGPSGVGKGTIISSIMKKYPNVFGFSVSHTTRAPRPGEENGVHYHFVDKSVMEAGIERGDFIEHAAVHTNYYGTSFQAVEKVRSSGKICILDIDIQGVQGVKASKLDAKYIFISPPSVEELEKRLRGRGTETEEKIQVRLKNAIDELNFGNQPGNFDAIIINEDLQLTIKAVIKQLQHWYPDYDLFD